MDVRFVNPFIAALSNVLPPLGFRDIARGKVLTKDQFVDSLGVTVNVGLIDQVTGYIVFNMTEESAKRLSSQMMMGASVEKLDDIAQSAICEMTNMITSNAANLLNQAGVAVRLTPPSFSHSTAQFKICDGKYIVIEMMIDQLPVEIGIGLNTV